MSKPLIIAHRGTATHALENTIAAFSAAIALQADMIELDVRKTQDQILIVHHDAHVAEGLIRDLTYAEILANNPQIPTLEATLQATSGKILLDIELKEIGDEQLVLEQVQQYFSVDQFVITSFHTAVVQTIQQLDSRIRTGQLWSSHEALRLAEVARLHQAAILNAPQIALLNKPDIWVLHWQLLQLDGWQQVQHWLPEIWVWTVNDTALLRSLLQDERIHGIITDRVDIAHPLRGSRSNALFGM